MIVKLLLEYEIKAQNTFLQVAMEVRTSNQMLLVACAEYNTIRPYSEMLTYKPLTNNAV